VTGYRIQRNGVLWDGRHHRHADNCPAGNCLLCQHDAHDKKSNTSTGSNTAAAMTWRCGHDCTGN
jgi:hypothetical protein